jgi:hypothetical protein
MSLIRGYRLGGVAVALGLGMTLIGVVYAQDVSGGVILGQVTRCTNGTETPAAGVSVSVQGASASAQTDSSGQFVLQVPEGQYTVVATASDGATTNLQNVPISGGLALDIGAMALNADAGGCGDASTAPPQAQATAATAATPAATSAPTAPAPTATAVPPTPPPPTATTVPTPVPTDQPPADDTSSGSG